MATQLENKGKVREKMFLMKKSENTQGNSWKSVKFREHSVTNEIALENDLENVDVAILCFHILAKDKSNQCYFLLYCEQFGIREKHFLSQEKVRKNENLKIMATLYTLSFYIQEIYDIEVALLITTAKS